MGVLERPWAGPQTSLAPLGRPGLDSAQAVQSASSEPNGPWSRCRCRTSCAPWTPPPSRVCCGSARGSTSRVSEGPRPLRPHGLAADRLPPTRTLETWGLRPGVRIRRCRYPSCVIGATPQLLRATALASVELVGGGGVVADCPAGWRWEVTELGYSGGWNRAKLGWNRRAHCRRSGRARSRHSGARDGELLLDDSEGPGQPSPPCTLRCPTLTPVYVSYSSVPPIPPLPLCSALGST